MKLRWTSIFNTGVLTGLFIFTEANYRAVWWSFKKKALKWSSFVVRAVWYEFSSWTKVLLTDSILSQSSELCPPIDANLGARRTKTTYSVIYPGQNREDPQLLGTTQKRKSEAEFGHPATKRRRINEKRGEMYHEMTLASNTTKPDEQLLQRVKDILKTKSKSQKELAREIKVR